MNSTDATFICLTPVKNEAWILERTLTCASLWADHIIVADQCSEDGSREIAARFPKVTIIDNDSSVYDEGARQKLLLDAARTIPGKRVLLAIDADEAISANWKESGEWDAIKVASPGTVIGFPWINLMPDFKSCGVPRENIPMGFVDDGFSGHSAGELHVPRLPIPLNSHHLQLKSICVLHYQYTDWDRMKSKQRKYQILERLHHPNRRAVDIFRQYHRMDAWPAEEVKAVREEWFANYEAAGINVYDVKRDEKYPMDREAVQLMLKHGTGRFRKLNIWDADWVDIGHKAGFGDSAELLSDPRSGFERRVHRWLVATQSRALDPKVRSLQRALRMLGW